MRSINTENVLHYTDPANHRHDPVILNTIARFNDWIDSTFSNSAISYDSTPDDGIDECQGRVVESVDFYDEACDEHTNLMTHGAARSCNICSADPDTSVLTAALARFSISRLGAELNSSIAVEDGYILGSHTTFEYNFTEGDGIDEYDVNLSYTKAFESVNELRRYLRIVQRFTKRAMPPFAVYEALIAQPIWDRGGVAPRFLIAAATGKPVACELRVSLPQAEQSA